MKKKQAEQLASALKRTHKIPGGWRTTFFEALVGEWEFYYHRKGSLLVLRPMLNWRGQLCYWRAAIANYPDTLGSYEWNTGTHVADPRLAIQACLMNATQEHELRRAILEQSTKDARGMLPDRGES